ncbi:MAG TPA: hypothetical protein VG142_10620 [Trebonia sp.]|jgi:hypothetical protein|nr:hypothetical protein [Trebonia sp.]
MTIPDTAPSGAVASGAVASGSDHPEPPRDFVLRLPPGWIRIPIDGREGARAAALATAKVSDLPEPQRSSAREKLTRMIKSTLREAQRAGGVDVLMSLAEAEGIPLAASCLISYVNEGGAPVPLDILADDLSADGGDARLVMIAGRPAVRYRHADPPLTMLEYMMALPGKPGLLTFAYSTPVEPLADALVVLFDAVMESLRWVK